MAQAGMNTTLISSQMYILIGAVALTVAIAFGFGAKEVVTDLLKNYYNRGVLNEGDKIKFGNYVGVIEKISKTSVVIANENDKLVVPSKDFYASQYTILKG